MNEVKRRICVDYMDFSDAIKFYTAPHRKVKEISPETAS